MDEKKKHKKNQGSCYRSIDQVNVFWKSLFFCFAPIYFTEIVELRARGNTEVKNILYSQERGRNNYFGV